MRFGSRSKKTLRDARILAVAARALKNAERSWELAESVNSWRTWASAGEAWELAADTYEHARDLKNAEQARNVALRAYENAVRRSSYPPALLRSIPPSRRDAGRDLRNRIKRLKRSGSRRARRA